MAEEQDVNKKIEEFLSEPASSSNGSAAKVGVAVFIAILSAFVVREAYEEYKLRQLARELQRSAQVFTRDLDRLNAKNQKRLREARLESQRRMRQMKAENLAKAKAHERQQYLNNYWKDIGNGTFINVGRSKRNGDLATAVIKVNNRQSYVSINCNKNTYWSAANNGWFPALDFSSTEMRMIRTACTSKDKGHIFIE